MVFTNDLLQRKNYFEKHKKFTKNLSELGIKKSTIEGYKLPPVIDITSDLFEAYLQSKNGIKKIHIRNDGLTWITINKK